MAAPTGWLTDKVVVEQRLDHLLEIDVVDASGNAETLRYSRRGFAAPPTALTTSQGDTIAANTQFAKRIKVAPVIEQSLWGPQSFPGGGGTFPLATRFVLNNADGGLDGASDLSGYRWPGATVRYFVVDTLDPENTITRLWRGTVDGQPKFSLDEVEVPLIGREAVFRELLTDATYRGTGPYWLELDSGNANATVTYGSAPAWADITGDFTIEGWMWVETVPSSANCILYGWSGSNAPFRLRLKTDGGVDLFATVSSSSESSSSGVTAQASRWYHVAVSVSGDDVTFVIWDDESRSETVTENASAFSGTRDANSGGGLVTRAAGGGVFWFDEFRLWSYARTVDEIRGDRFGPIDETDLPADLEHLIHANDGSGATVSDDGPNAGGDGTVSTSGTGSSTWLRGVEGHAELAGIGKPEAWGWRSGVEPVLLDPVDQIYQVASFGDINAIQVFEGGSQVGTPVYTDAASLRAFLVTTPASGAVLTYLAKGLFKLGSNPTLPILCFVKGYDDGAAGLTDTVAALVRDTVTRRGPRLTWPDDFNTSDFTVVDDDFFHYIGEYYPEPRPIGELLDSAVQSIGGYWGWPDIDDKFTIRAYTGPEAAADWDFDERHIVRIERREVDIHLHELILRFRHLDRALSEDEIAAAIIDTASRNPWVKEWRQKRISDPDVKSQFPPPGSRSLTVDTLFWYLGNVHVLASSYPIMGDGLGGTKANILGAAAEAARRFAIFKKQPVAFDVTFDVSAAEVKLDQTVSLSFVDQKGTTRLGLDGTTMFSVLDKRLDLQRGQVSLGLLGFLE